MRPFPLPALSRPVPPTASSKAADRPVGVEIEFIGIDVRRAAEALQRRFSGELVEEDPQAAHLIGSGLGDIRIELDVRHVHPHRGAASPLGGWPAFLATGLGKALAPLVPREVIIGPLDRPALESVNEAVEVLRAAGARGSGATLLEALGLHFNIAQPEKDAVAILATFKAFLMLEPELRRANGNGALARLHAPPPFPADYVQRVLSPGYWPDIESFTLDYLAANPTRKRSLDLLPLLLHYGAGRALPRFAGKVRPRPAFHYRLPLAHVGRPGWTVTADWEGWLAVERLAASIGRDRPRRAPGTGRQ